MTTPDTAPGQGHGEKRAKGRGDGSRVRGEERADGNRKLQAQGLKGDGSRRNPDRKSRA